MEKTVIQSFLYPAFLCPPPSMNFDQIAFRRTGFTQPLSTYFAK